MDQQDQDLGKIACFLLSGLRVSADRYKEVLEEYSHDLAARGLQWQDMSEEALDVTPEGDLPNGDFSAPHY